MLKNVVLKKYTIYLNDYLFEFTVLEVVVCLIDIGIVIFSVGVVIVVLCCDEFNIDVWPIRAVNVVFSAEVILVICSVGEEKSSIKENIARVFFLLTIRR